MKHRRTDHKISFGATVLLMLSLLLAPAAESAQLRISVAASMAELFKALTADFTTQHPQLTVLTNVGSSGGLAKQISHGAPADLYVSANPSWMDYLVEQGKIEAASRIIFARNSLVFIGDPKKMIRSLADLVNLERIGLGSPSSVPAGQYARQALASVGLYQPLKQAGKLVMAKDVRQALIYGDRGETDGSFVYTTDALLASRAVILFTVPQELYSAIYYPLALTRQGAARPAARKLYTYLRSERAAALVLRYGFGLPH